MVKFPCEAIWSRAFVCWELFEYWFNSVSLHVLCVFQFSSCIDFKFHIIVIREDAWYDFNLLELLRLALCSNIFFFFLPRQCFLVNLWKECIFYCLWVTCPKNINHLAWCVIQGHCFCLDDLPIDHNWVLKFHSIFVLLWVSLSVNICYIFRCSYIGYTSVYTSYIILLNWDFIIKKCHYCFFLQFLF